jgi:hypothetical protein
MRALRQLANSKDPNSLAVRMRRKRFELFRSLVNQLPRPISILDVGGTESFWRTMGWVDEPGLKFHILNLAPVSSGHPSVKTHVGDARNMSEFGERQFDVVFSNSVIEHVGGFAEQQRMAEEIRRVGGRYFVQTPNRFFPIEPHFLLPFFQFLPFRLKVAVIRHVKGVKDRSLAERRAGEIHLLSRKKLMSLFPGANLSEERIAGIAKSFMVYGGWD